MSQEKHHLKVRENMLKKKKKKRKNIGGGTYRDPKIIKVCV
jgi:hypothetical protein